MKKKNHYFEGWYIKSTTAKHTLVLIPGLSITDGKREAFLQVILDETSYFIPYKASQYQSNKQEFLVRVGRNVFTTKGCSLQIHTDELSITGSLCYGRLNRLAYSFMGPLHFLPSLACRHEVISMDHALYGTLTVNGTEMNFKGGRGYIESDRGRSFPESYTWSQCNQFKKSFTTITGAVADVPIGSHSFSGTCAIILYKGKEYRLSTYLGAKIRLFTARRIILTQGNMILKISLLKAKPVKLAAPINGAMIRSIEEHPRCTVHYYFSVNNRVLIDETCEQASFESSFISKVFVS